MRKIYFLFAFAILNTSVFAQVTLSNGANIFLSSGSVFSTNTSVTLNGNAVIENNGDFAAGSMETNGTSSFDNNSGANFNLSNTLKLNNTSVFNNNGGTALVADSTIISSTLANTGDFGSRYFDVLSVGTAQNGGAFQIQNTFFADGGATFVTNTGALEFVGNDDNKRLNTDAIGPFLPVRSISFNASNPARNIILESVVRVIDTADFNSGIVSYNGATDSLVILSGGVVTMDSAFGNGVMTDVLYRYPAGVGDFMRFPVGDASVKFRPFWVMSSQYSGATPPKIGVEYLGNKVISDTNAVGYNTTYNTNSWGLYDLDGNFDSSIVQVQFGSADGVDTSESIIAQGFSVVAGDTIFFNLGQGSSNTNGIGGIVQSKIPANGENSVIMIGQSTELRVRIMAYLEGAQNAPGTAIFDTDILAESQLTNRFEFIGGTSSQPMFKGKSVPSGPPGAVDSIRLILRDVGNNDVDTASAWLMSDGSIRDYLTGELNYAVFSNAPSSTNYYVVLDHRNHLRVRSSTTFMPSNTGPGVFVNFTDPTSIFGGGGIKLISPGSAMIAGGNSNGDAAVNAIDYFQVGNSNFANDTGYRNTNVFFNNGNAANVDASDFTKVQENSQVIYFSTAQ